MEVTNNEACCALGDINELSHYRTPLAAMRAFCCEVEEQGCGGYNEYRKDCELDPSGSRSFAPHNLYIFTGVIKQPKAHGKNVTYGQEFAKFIVENDLGEITEGPERFNINNHSNHLVKVWIWAVNQENLRDWWINDGKRVKSEKVKGVSRVSAGSIWS